jgi:hypothetical protein
MAKNPPRYATVEDLKKAVADIQGSIPSHITNAVSAAFSSQAQNPQTEQPTDSRYGWINSPWVIGLVTGTLGCIVGGIFVFWLQSNQTHNATDLASAIKIEVSGQLAPIETGLTTQQQQMNSGLSSQMHDLDVQLSGIRERLKAVETKAQDAWDVRLRHLSTAPQSEFQRNLATIPIAFKSLQDDGKILPFKTVEGIQARLLKVNTPDPNYWMATEATINYASFIRERLGLFPNPALARAQPCRIPFDNPAATITLDRVMVKGCTLNLDGKTLVGSYFENSILIYHGGEVHLKNVTFKNCLFVFVLPPQTRPQKQLVESVLASAGEKQPILLVNTG